MQSTTYKDIIDGKIAEWKVNLKKIEEQAGKASSDSESRSSAKVKDLKSAIDSATAQLQTLDAQETVENTMATKDKILEIFGSIDKQFIEFEDKTPFML